MNAPLHTLADWRAAYAGGAQPAALLAALLDSLATDDPAWIWRAPPDFVAGQVAALPASPDATMPLWGVPFAVKDNIDVAGIPTTGACPAFAYRPERTATVVARLQAAGAVLVGKTNLDQFATGLVGTRSPYGAVPNTFDPAYVSGGSSSGSASVVARGLVPFALGTDTAGSGRVPAGFNNLVGLKPTPGGVPMAGVLPACRTLDVVSVFALTVADAALVMALVEGADGEPRFNEAPPRPDWLGPGGAPPRLGVPARPGCDAALGWDAAFDEAGERARALGAELVTVDFEPLFEVARLLYQGPWVAERHLVARALLASDPAAIDPVVREILRQAEAFDADAAFDGRYTLAGLRARIAPMWQQVDALMVPTAVSCPTRAAVAQEPVLRNAELGLYTNFVNLLGLAALALPSRVPVHGVPFGVTFIAPGGSDAALLRWGLDWERHGPATLGARLRTAHAGDRMPLREHGSLPAAAPVLALAVVGAHLSGMPLHGQLVERNARLLARTRTAPRYRLFELPGTVPPKPGLARASEAQEGHAIEVEVYEMPLDAVGGFLALIPPPLGLGSVELADGRWVKGFICEPHALDGARDISAHGGWRAWRAGQ
jgi:allophanate hydrolase